MVRVIEVAQVAAEELSIQVGLIVVDALSRTIAGGNENSPDDMGALVRNTDTIRQTLGAHVATIHHSGKDTARGARGRSLLRAATDTEIEVSREPVTKTSVPRVTKQRELDLDGGFSFELLPVELGTNRRGKAATSCVARAADEGSNRGRTPAEREIQKDRVKRAKEREQNELDAADVLRVVDAEHRAGLPGASQSWIEDHTECSKVRAMAAVERLREQGILIEVGRFQKSSGKGARATVEKGWGRPEEERPSTKPASSAR
ncbi:atpase aaa : Uncharacterized protein OS=Phaeospirillum molischianum DSM 120 GN=PHAMO_290104 PE=4 SV=1: AAA_25 [Gemmata massiliana]|uniref:Uncharacterized protein n=1 Tax=Gemmata massiliana TaxID=1210884 RepID=A0A6P2D0G7_9BACT|nr:AAA family ATPase [Gemmata massiliana]VTR94741.1 atpase aaa : Uncharacterized protein OS=Phaeospirillum molischianum DSM 120 GN=PHAMO_290104 PE=4 SV=1: AAA_25 [Gemmata massiliana]